MGDIVVLSIKLLLSLIELAAELDKGYEPALELEFTDD